MNVSTIIASPDNIPTMIVGDYLGSNAPASFAQALADERAAVFCACSKAVFRTNWSRNPNAKLWASTSGTIPTENTYSVVYASFLDSKVVDALVYFNTIIEWVVEFRGSQ